MQGSYSSTRKLMKMSEDQRLKPSRTSEHVNVMLVFYLPTEETSIRGEIKVFSYHNINGSQNKNVWAMVQ